MLANVGHINAEQNYKYSILDTIAELNSYDVTLRRSGCTTLDLVYVLQEE